LVVVLIFLVHVHTSLLVSRLTKMEPELEKQHPSMLAERWNCHERQLFTDFPLALQRSWWAIADNL